MARTSLNNITQSAIEGEQGASSRWSLGYSVRRTNGLPKFTDEIFPRLEAASEPDGTSLKEYLAANEGIVYDGQIFAVVNSSTYAVEHYKAVWDPTANSNAGKWTAVKLVPPAASPSAFQGTDGSQAGVAGLVPAPATTEEGKFLCANGQWDTPPDPDPFSGVSNGEGLVPVDNDGNITGDQEDYFLNAKGKWAEIKVNTFSGVGSGEGLVPEDNDGNVTGDKEDYFLNGKGKWAEIKKFSGASSNSDGSTGLVPQPLTTAADHDKFLRGNGTWDWVQMLKENLTLTWDSTPIPDSSNPTNTKLVSHDSLLNNKLYYAYINNSAYSSTGDVNEIVIETAGYGTDNTVVMLYIEGSISNVAFSIKQHGDQHQIAYMRPHFYPTVDGNMAYRIEFSHGVAAMYEMSLGDTPSVYIDTTNHEWQERVDLNISNPS